MLFQELKNFKGVLAFMLIPIIGMMMNGHVQAGLWTAVMIYFAMPGVVMALDAMNVGDVQQHDVVDQPLVNPSSQQTNFTNWDDWDDGFSFFKHDDAHDRKFSPAYSFLSTNIWHDYDHLHD